jgi:hypothetical protein
LEFSNEPIMKATLAVAFFIALIACSAEPGDAFQPAALACCGRIAAALETNMGNEIYDDLDELPPAPRVDIPDADLVLLEGAARAIGAVRVEVVDGEGYVNLHLADSSIVHSWNPLTFSGDALDLAVRRRLEIYIHKQDTRVVCGNLEPTTEQHGDDAGAATRRAITRAASRT